MCIRDRFTRGSASAHANASGTGLGLPISKMLTQLMGGEMKIRSAPLQGSLFHIRLFLPSVHVTGKALRELEAPAQQRTGYRGPRRRILVVDNERVDRELLLNILAPLGFEIAQAASGLECLDLHAAFQPDLILMDLAMPGMDGWEASYILRRRQLSQVPIAIVSANAFDKGMENAAGIKAEDFIIKPVNVGELLDWIGRRLALDWITQPRAEAISSEMPAAAGAAAMVMPPVAQMAALEELIRIGYVRGIQSKLDEIDALDAQYSRFTHAMRDFAKRFQLDAMADFVRKNKSDELQH